MSNEIAHIEFSRDKVQLLKDTICKGATDSELELFVHVSQRLGLDPFMKQIHPVKRWDAVSNKEVMSIQTGIDGYRLIAERSGKYMPGKEPSFTYHDNGQLKSATSYVKKLAPDGHWHEIASTAFYEEYVAKKKDGSPVHMWKDKPHIMLSKCAESAALRRAFPAEMSGVYTDEEMEHVSIQTQLIGNEKAREIEDKIGDDYDYLKKILNFYKKNSIAEIELSHLSVIERQVNKYNEERLKSEMNSTIEINNV